MTSSSLNKTGERGLGRIAHRILVLDLAEDTRIALPRRVVDTDYDKVLASTFAELNAPTFSDFDPEIIVAPLLSKHTDALDLAEYLELLEFRGRLVVVAEKLPNPALVERELRRAAPSLKLEIFDLRSGSGLRQV